MFKDFKSNGFYLENTHLWHFQRLSGFSPWLWFCFTSGTFPTGSYAIKRGWRHLVDRKDRRDLSLFRIGTSIIKRHLNLHLHLPFRLTPLLLLITVR